MGTFAKTIGILRRGQVDLSPMISTVVPTYPSGEGRLAGGWVQDSGIVTRVARRSCPLSMMDTIAMTGRDESDASTNGSGRRRYWKKDEKRRIVAESFSEGGSVAEVARRYGLNANLLFTWRRQLAATKTEARDFYR